jgi:hypothetical protein
MFIVLTPPHEKGCICEWCMAIKREGKKSKWLDDIEKNARGTKGYAPPPAPSIRLERAEPPPEKSDPVPSHRPGWDEVAAQREKQKDAARAKHPSTQISVSGPLTNITLNGNPIELPHLPIELIPTPTFDTAKIEYVTPTPVIPGYSEVAEHAAEFKRHPERAKPQSSGCWYCEDEDVMGPLCGVCQHMVDDYHEWHAGQLPAVEI